MIWNARHVPDDVLVLMVGGELSPRRARRARRHMGSCSPCRRRLTEFDRMMLDWAHTSGMPLHILLTKADKLAFGAAKNALLKVQKDVRQGWGDGISVQLFSAPKRQGIEEAQAVLARWLGLGEEARADA